jgi:hypothetical protein
MSSEDDKTNESKRKQVRYAVSDDCRVRAAIMIRSSDRETAAKDWPGTLVDVSSGGAHIQISLGAVAYQGDSCVLKLSLGAVKAELSGSLAHYVCSARNSVCGVKFDFSYAGSDKAYQPFYKALVASSALKAGPAGNESAKRHREEYNGPGATKLVVWREEAGGGATILAFDYTMVRYGVALASVGPDMFKNKEQVRFRAVAVDGSDSGVTLAKSQELEARWEYSLAASNLPKSIAPDIRKLLRLTS